MGAQSARIGDAMRAHVGAAAKMLALQIVAELKKHPGAGGTPVATGHARANWVPSVGAPHAGEDSGAASAAGTAQIMAYVLEQGPLWVSNNVPYIRFLNYGSSQQAPAMFVEAAVMRAFAFVEAKLGREAVAGIRSSYEQGVSGAAAGNLASAYNPLGGSDD